MRNIAFFGCLFTLAGCMSACTSDQTMQGIALASEAMPCYTAVVAATNTPAGQSNATKAINAANALATNAACIPLDTGTVSLISSLVTSGTTPAAAVATPVAKPAATTVLVP